MSGATYNRRQVFTVSSLRTYAQCPLSFKLRYVDDAPCFETVAQRIGTEVHAAIASATRPGGDWDEAKGAAISNMGGECADMLDIFSAIEFRRPSLRFVDVGELEELRVEQSIMFDANGNPTANPELAVFAMTPDLVVNAPNLVLIRDYKTSREMPYGELLEADLQLRAYAWGTLKTLGDFGRVVILEKDYVRFPHGLVSATVAGEQFAGVWSELCNLMDPIIDALNSGAFDARPNEHCAWCGVRHSCETWNTSTAVVAQEAALVSAADAERVAVAVRIAEQRVYELKEQLKDYVRNFGPIRVNGSVLDFVERKRTEVDVAALVAALQSQGIDNATILGMLETSKSTVETWRKSHLPAKSPEGKDLKAAVETAYRDTYRTEFRWSNAE